MGSASNGLNARTIEPLKEQIIQWLNHKEHGRLCWPQKKKNTEDTEDCSLVWRLCQHREPYMDSESDLSANHPILQQDLPEGIIIYPSRHEFLEKLPFNIRVQLKDEYCYISHDLAKLILGEERYNTMLTDCESDSTPLYMSDLKSSNGSRRVILFWEVKNVSYSPVHPYATSLVESAGFIRDQKLHKLCWAYGTGDLVSITRVLYGLDDSFTPLSAQYMCRNVSPADLNTSDREHCCYANGSLNALVFIKTRGVPIERPEEKEFNCFEDGVYDSEYRRIKNIYYYETLQEALVRLQTHPVEATLQIFVGWEREGVYRGPFHGGEFIGDHSVVMIACEQIEGETVVVCKSSNGESLGRGGYILVSADVMIMDIARPRKYMPSEPDGSNLLGKYYPLHLLKGFYSVDVDVPKNGKRYISKEMYKENLKYRVDTTRLGRVILAGTSGMALHKREIVEMRTSVHEGSSLEYLPRQLGRIGVGTDLPYRMAVHPGVMIGHFSNSCRLDDWETIMGPIVDDLAGEHSMEVLEDVGQQTALAFNQERSVLATAREDVTLRVFKWHGMNTLLNELQTHSSSVKGHGMNTLLNELQTHSSSVKGLSFSESGIFLVSLGGQLFRVWEVNTSSAVAVPSKEKDEMFACWSFSVDSVGNEVVYVAAKTDCGGMIITCNVQNNHISAIKVSADGKLLAIGTIEGDVLILDLTKMQPKQIVRKAHLSTVTALIFSHDSRCLVSVDSDSWARLTID